MNRQVSAFIITMIMMLAVAAGTIGGAMWWIHTHPDDSNEHWTDLRISVHEGTNALDIAELGLRRDGVVVWRDLTP